jgi:Asp-tRNA(Asn)/Glu-tRNA(Gln) amidotransferase A subunit family amidase
MTDQSNESRRRFLRVIPAAVAGAIAAPALAQQAAGDLTLTKETLDCGEKIFGVDFTDAEEDAIVRGVNRNLESFEALRKVDIPLDTDIPLVFHPYLPGNRPKPGATPGAPLNVTLTPPAARRASVDDLAFEPATALAPLLKNRDVSATDLTRMYLARLKKYGPKLNCVVTLTEDLALQQAADADREIAAGRYKGPLHGIPWGAKDLFATRGIPTTWGAGPYQNQVFDYDATIVSRLRDAGAVLLAKLSMGALAQGDRWFRGQTKNPWRPDDPNPNRSGSSGSSAGPGSATAAGLVVFGIGTETRGSIISPSSVNGVTGLRPTYGRVSRFGAMMLSWTMDKVGPMCRSVEDCALVFNAIYGPDGKDDSVADAPFAWNPDVPLSKLRIGFIQRDFELQPPGGRGGAPGGGGGRGGAGRGGISPEEFRRQREAQLKILEGALDAYRKLGVTLIPIEQVPGTDIANDIGFVLNVEAAAAFDDLTRSAGINDESVQQWAGTFRTSRFVPAVEYIRAQRARTLLMRQWDEFMSHYDAFLSPAGGSTLGITNLTGHPALALKAGFNDGAPVELMVTGRLYDEATVLRVALAFERATPWHTMNPTVNW